MGRALDLLLLGVGERRREHVGGGRGLGEGLVERKGIKVVHGWCRKK